MDITSQMLQFLITGLTTGSIYALVAIGFVTIYNVTGVLNFAQGEFAMLGALTCISLVNMGLAIGAAIPLAILITALIGLTIERTTIFPSRNSSFITLIIITLGVSILLRGLGLIMWGTYPLSLSSFSNNQPIQIFGAVLIPQSIWVFAILFVLLGLLYLFFEKTFLGSAVKASVINPTAAQLMGINPQSMSAFAFTMSAALGAIAGIITAPITGAMYDMGFLLGLKGFVAMVIGGMNNVSGAVLAGFLLGIVESFSGGYISTAYSDAISFAILLLVLFLSPNGLLAKASGKRV
jgi:branched-chain amino acid transport system permease protein